jgi:hypothetical protein
MSALISKGGWGAAGKPKQNHTNLAGDPRRIEGKCSVPIGRAEHAGATDAWNPCAILRDDTN